jgi:hypothetical protein
LIGIISPIIDAPVLVVEGDQKVLVAADIHLGIEYELWLGGANIPSQTKRILAKLQSYIEMVRPDRLVLLGDIKHNVPRMSWQERDEVPAFLGSLLEKVDVDLVPGNHDGGLADLVPPDIRMLPASGYLLDNVGYFHGHSWPDVELFRSEMLIASHIHPTIRLIDPLGYSSIEQVWVRSPVDSALLEKHYGCGLKSPPMIIVPAFNELCGGRPLNVIYGDCDRGPISKMADLDLAEIYLLDGTHLGRLDKIKAAYRDL